MKTDRLDYEKLLTERTPSLRRKHKKLDLIKDNLVEYGFMPGKLQEVLNNPEERLSLLSDEELYLLGKQMWLYLESEDDKDKIDPDKFFTDKEKRDAESYSGAVTDKSVDFPIIKENVEYMGDDTYQMSIHVSELKKWLDAMIIDYNFNIQREAEIVIIDGKKVKKPKRYQKNIDEMVDKLLKGTLKRRSQIALNARIRTAENNKDELEYNPTTRQLIINEGTILDILDGYHRTQAVQIALEMNPNIDFTFSLAITNHSDQKAMQIQAEIANEMKISEARKQAISIESYTNTVISELNSRSELSGKIGEGTMLRPARQEIVSYKTLTYALENNFDIKNKPQAYDIADYLVDFFDTLIGTNSDIFNKGFKKEKDGTLLNYPSMFAGYIVLAARFMDENISARDIRKVINKIDFNRSNPLWQELDILDEKRNIKTGSSVRVEDKIMRYFKEYDLKEGAVS